MPVLGRIAGCSSGDVMESVAVRDVVVVYGVSISILRSNLRGGCDTFGRFVKRLFSLISMVFASADFVV